MSRVAMRVAFCCVCVSCITDVIAVMTCCVDLPCLNPNCKSVKILWCSKYCINLFVNILSSVLQSVSNS